MRPRCRWPTRPTWTSAATTVEDLQILAPTVPADVLEQVMAADPTLDADVAAWFDPDSGRAKLAVLGPVTLTTTQPPPKRVAYYAELAAYLAFRPQGATAEEIRTSFGLSAGSARAYLSTLREYLGKDPLTGAEYMAGAKDSAAGKARGVGVYQTCGVLLDADLFRRLRSRGQARGPAGLEDYATALRLVTGRPFSQMREEGGAWLLEGTGSTSTSLSPSSTSPTCWPPAPSQQATPPPPGRPSTSPVWPPPTRKPPGWTPPPWTVPTDAPRRPAAPSSSRSATAPTTGKRRWTSAPEPGRSSPTTATGYPVPADPGRVHPPTDTRKSPPKG